VYGCVQYYYNTEAQAFMYWDGEKQTYLPATNTDTTTAVPPVLSQELNKEETDEKKTAPDDKKVKVAKKIVKVCRLFKYNYCEFLRLTYLIFIHNVCVTHIHVYLSIRKLFLIWSLLYFFVHMINTF